VKVLLIDNFDSFTFNLFHYLEAEGAEVTVLRNDEIEMESVPKFDKIVLSPGPG
jgi:anthranilate synthase component 2